MFFFFAALVVGLILSIFLAPKPKFEKAKAAQLSDFRFPRSEEGDPVPRIYGTVKTRGVNTIGQCNFKAVPIKKKMKTGLFSSKKVVVGYQYHCGIDLAVCLGPGVVFRRMWYGNHLIWAGCLYDEICYTRWWINLPELLGGPDKNGGISGWVGLHCGNFDQVQDPYLQANLTKLESDDQVPAYPGIAHMVFEDFWWGNSPSIETISVEVAYFTNALNLPLSKNIMSNGFDANPVEVLYDLYTNEWGNLGVAEPIFDLPSWTAAALRVWDENNGLSVEIANPQSGAEMSKEILRQIDGMIFQNPVTGMIELLLMRRDYVVGDLVVLGPDQISEITSFTKKLWDDTFNRVRIQYKNRDNEYQPAVATADDFGNIRFQGRVAATEIGMPLCYVSDLANQLAARELSNLNVPLYQCELTLNRTHTELTPGGVFVLNWPDYAISGIVMRIRKIGLGSRKDGKVTLKVVQDQFSSDAVVVSSPVLPITDGADYKAHDIVNPQFFELPYWMASQYGAIPAAGRTIYGTFAKAPGSASLDYRVLVNDTPEDIEVLSNAPYTATATLVAGIGKYTGFTTALIETLDIKDVSDASALTVNTTAEIQTTGKGLFMLGGELFAYESFTAGADSTGTLNNVHRALLDTKPTASAADSVLYFFDGPEGFWDADIPAAPTTAYALDRAATGGGSEDTAAVVALTPVERAALPLPPDYLAVNGTRSDTAFALAGDTISISWVERNRTDAVIRFEDDGAFAAEAGTTYSLSLVNEADDTILQGPIVATSPYDLLLDAGSVGSTRIEVVAIRGGKTSFKPAIHPLSVLLPTTLLVDGDPVFIDGLTVEFS